MPRRWRCHTGGYAYHALNRGVGRATIFHKDGDYAAFEKTLRQAKDWCSVRCLGYCLMPNPWHLVLWPRNDGDLSKFLRWLTVTHTQRYHAHYHTAGSGPLYQGRFKSFPIEEDEHLLTVLRYVERNPLRAELVTRAEDWRWSSLAAWRAATPLLWRGVPPLRGKGWLARVRGPLSAGDLERLRHAVERGRPFGDEAWTEETAVRLGLESC